MKRSTVVASLFLGFLLVIDPGSVSAQTGADSIFVIGGRTIRGTIQSISPLAIEIEPASGNSQKISPADIRRVRFADEPNWLARARTSFDDQRYNACYSVLNDNQETPQRQAVVQEADFFKAMSAARMALAGEQLTTAQAKDLVNQFITSHNNSYHLVPMVDALGDLELAEGNFAAASAEFQKLAGVDWPIYQLNGQLKLGLAQLRQGQFQEALQSFGKVESVTGNGDEAQQAKLIARCFQAQAMGEAGRPDEGIELAAAIVQNESSENQALFARAYNALGICYLKKNNPKAALDAFLHTDVMFYTEKEAHAEALFYLYQLWNDAKKTDRAMRAKEQLKQRYRNTHWAARIG